MSWSSSGIGANNNNKIETTNTETVSNNMDKVLQETETVVASGSLQVASSKLVPCDERDSQQAGGNSRLATTTIITRNQTSGSGQQITSNAMSINKQHLSARAKTITGKLLESHGAELRRTLFSLRQIFQDDSELATEFIESDGFECLMKVAIDADQIHQNYILRALGQLIAYPSGMSSLARHLETIKWLYTLLGSQHRLVVKTSLKLLLQFVEQSDNNCHHFCRAIKSVEETKGTLLWTNLIELFKTHGGKDGQQTGDVELLVEAMTLINKTLDGIPDQDTYYDFVDPLEELGIEDIINKYSSSNEHLREQFEIYEQVLRTEDEDNSTTAVATVANKELNMVIRDTNTADNLVVDNNNRRRMKRNQEERQQVEEGGNEFHEENYESASETNESNKQLAFAPSSERIDKQENSSKPATTTTNREESNTKSSLARGKQQRASISSCSSSDSYASYGSGYASGSGNSTDHEHKQKNLSSTNEESDQTLKDSKNEEEEIDDDSQLRQHLSELEQLTDELASRNIFGSLNQPIQSTSKHFSSTIKSNSSSIISTGSNVSSLSSSINEAPQQVQADLEGSRSTSTTPTSIIQPNSTITSSYKPTYLTNQTNNGEMAQQRPVPRPAHHYASPATNSPSIKQHSPVQATQTSSSKHEPYYHNLFQWEQLVSKGVTRPLLINDLDFTDLREEDDCDLLNTSNNVPGARGKNQVNGEPLTISIPDAQQHIKNKLHDSVDGDGVKVNNPGTPASAPPPMPPPPISPWFNTISGSRPQSQILSSPSPTYEQQSYNEFARDQSPAGSTYSNYSRNSVCLPQTSTPTREPPSHHMYNTLQPVSSLRSASSMSSLLFGNNGKYANKRKKTMKLFWKEVREDKSLLSKLTKKKTIWDEIKPVEVDTQKLEHLFESKAKDLLLSKSRNGLDSLNQRKVKITVLDAKRSNAINIGMTKLPPMRTIKSAILKMDSSIMNREGIEKILSTMMPTEEEKSRIIEAQLANPDTPLGTAEQFLLNLASISALEARLKLWAFQLDYAQIEKEVAEPLMDLKQAIEEIEGSETFRLILGTLLAIGNFLNSTNVKGFQIDYLEKVPEVKDTVHKHSLLHHLCLFIQEKYDPELSSDLYSEFSAVNRASKIDYTEVAKNLRKMQQDCKASWDYLKIVAKHDGLANLMNTSSSSQSSDGSTTSGQQPKSSGKLNNLSKLSMITTVMNLDSSNSSSTSDQSQQTPTNKQLKTKVSDFLTDCAERIMVLIVIHRRVMNRFQKLLVYLGCPSHQIKQTQPQQILKIINEFALEYRTKRERVLEMLLKKQQCQHSHLGNRWQTNRSRWAGSQQCIDSLSYNQPINRPCSTASSCASSSSYAFNPNCTDCALSMANNKARLNSSEPNHGNHHSNRASSPSGFSQISNYSDYLLDQSCCNSRQQSITPVPASEKNDSLNQRRLSSMSSSMFDLQNQQNSRESSATSSTSKAVGIIDDARNKDEQLRRLLGGGKSFDGSCSDLYQAAHWSSTTSRVTRHPPAIPKQRAVSIDTSAGEDSVDRRHQSSYYRHLRDTQYGNRDDEPNSDDEILQSLVRTATAKGNQSHQHNRSADSSRPTTNKASKTKILSRFNFERKSLRRTLAPGIELSNVG